MILSGEKKEEYREIKEYWIRRLFVNWREYFQLQEKGKFKVAAFDRIIFRNGYNPDSPKLEIECTGIEIGYGLQAWGASPNVKYFVIKLGSLINSTAKPPSTPD